MQRRLPKRLAKGPNSGSAILAATLLTPKAHPADAGDWHALMQGLPEL
jgi:hypothetical protein